MKFIRKCFQGLKPYYSKHTEDGIILNANESPFNIPNELKEHMKNWIDQNHFNRYPDTDHTKLISSIAKRYQISSENVTCGVGSDEMLECLYHATIDPSNYVLCPAPSFSMYTQLNTLHLGNILYAHLNDDFSYNVDYYLDIIKTYNPKLIIICNPNNPTGSIMEKKDIIKIVEATNQLVIVDEAYEEFANISMIDLIDIYDNLIVLKTFSKAYSLANVRCGYVISNRANIDMINTIKPPYNLNAFSMEICSWVMENHHMFESNIEYLKEERKHVYKALTDLKIEVYPSQANFLWMRLDELICDKLLEHKIYIRKLSYNNISYQRITIGTKTENDKLLEIIKRYYEEAL